MQNLRLSSLLSTFLVLLFHSSSLAFSSPTKQLLLSSQTQSLYTQLLEFSKTNIDPSSLTITVNNQDVTKRVDFTQVGSTVLLEYKLLTNLPAKANAEFVIRAKTRGTMSEPPVDLELKTNVDIVGKFSAAPINLIELSPTHNDDTLPIDPFALEDTPTVVYAGGQVNVLYKTGDDLSNLEVKVPVAALNEKGEIVKIDYPSVRFNDQNWTNGSFSLTAPMKDGVALVPIKLKIANPASFSIDIDTIIVRMDEAASTNGAVIRPQALILLAIPVAISAFDAVAALIVGTAATYAVVNTAMCIGDPSYCQSTMNGIADELLQSGRAVPLITPSIALPSNGVCRATTTAAPAARKQRNRALAPIASPVQCVPKPDQSAGSSSKPSQERFNENEAKPPTLDYDAQQGIWDKFLQEADLFCRFGKGTFDGFSQAEKDALIEAGKLWKGGGSNGANRKTVLDFLKSKGLIGEFGKFTGHHQNSKACYPSLARDITNLTIVESKDSVHRDICHGGKYGNCTFGELFKETADIITDFLADPNTVDLTTINQCR